MNKVTVTVVFGLVTLGWLLRKRFSKKETTKNPAAEEPPSSFSPSSSQIPSVDKNQAFDFDVFLSFRGDTRSGFTSHLHQRLDQRGIRTFIDEEDLKKGEKITKLIKCIEGSNIFIPILSKGYAESHWCLMEIAKIVESKRLIIPVFYHVDPSDVRRQKGPFERAFAHHQKKEEGEKVKEWRKALSEVGAMSGYVLSAKTIGNEAKLIDVILRDVQLVLSKVPMEVAAHPVGIDSPVGDMLKLLDLHALNDVRMVGIYGEGGLGKTTISKAVYNALQQRFQGSCFLLDVRARSNLPNGLASLQTQLIKDILEQQHVSVNDVEHGIATIKQRIKSKKILLVLDDVDSKEQLDKLAGDPEWFGPGSRIIISTRDRGLLDLHRVSDKYEPRKLDRDQSLQLFSCHAFASEGPLPEYKELSKRVIEYAGGMPLALEVFGPIFFNIRSEKEWLHMLEKLKAVQNKELSKRLKISYEALDEEEKCVFLDIACCFIGKELKYPQYMWDAMDYHPNITIKALRHKSLIKIEKNEVRMHDQIRDMGRNIVKEEAFGDPGLRSRLWKYNEISPLLEEPTQNIEVIILEYEYKSKQSEEKVSSRAFAEMPKLRFLRTKHATFGDGVLQFPRRIKCLQLTDSWSNTLIFDTSCLQELAVLDLSKNDLVSQISWNHQTVEAKSNKRQAKNEMSNLKVLDLNHCVRLIASPDFSVLPGLEKLVLDTCYSLAEVDSIGQLKTLTYLSMRSCKKLKHLPNSICELENLETLDLSDCGISELPERLGDLQSLKKLDVSSTGLRKLPISTTQLTTLTILKLGLTKLKELPEEIGRLKSLEELHLLYCKQLERMPESVGNLMSLKVLDLKATPISELPESLGKMSNLSDLILRECKNLTATPDFCGCSEIRELKLYDCDSLIHIESIGQLKNLIHLAIKSPELKYLPDSIFKLKDLEVLGLLGCDGISELPETLGCLASLKKLYLAWTNVRKLPTSTIQLTRLSELNMTGTKLEELPEDIGKLESLKSLILSKTLLRRIPDSIGKLVNLGTLSLSDCSHLEKLPDTVGGLKSLEELKLDKTPLRALPDSVNSLSSLKELNLSETNITKITETSIIQLTGLSKLDLTDSKLEELPEEIGNLESLESLLLGGTLLKRIPDSIGKLVNLQTLRCSRCSHLEKLPATIGGLKCLKELKLYGTPLRAVPDSLNSLSSLETLNLSETNITNIIETSNIEGLSSLEDLRVNKCQNLSSLPRLPCSLEFLRARDCTALERMEDISSLKKLRLLDLTNCKKLTDVPGLDTLFPLRHASLCVYRG